MISLQNLLEARSHRDLELMARAHKLPFSRRDSKRQGLEALSTDLKNGAYDKAIKSLTPSEIEALQALVAHGTNHLAKQMKTPVTRGVTLLRRLSVYSS